MILTVLGRVAQADERRDVSRAEAITCSLSFFTYLPPEQNGCPHIQCIEQNSAIVTLGNLGRHSEIHSGDSNAQQSQHATVSFLLGLCLSRMAETRF